jgi:hypothetical protein
MIDAKQIPDDVVEAMARPVTYPSGASVKYINALHLAAALNAWPNMITGPEGIFLPRILPLTQETSNE